MPHESLVTVTRHCVATQGWEAGQHPGPRLPVWPEHSQPGPGSRASLEDVLPAHLPSPARLLSSTPRKVESRSRLCPSGCGPSLLDPQSHVLALACWMPGDHVRAKADRREDSTSGMQQSPRSAGRPISPSFPGRTPAGGAPRDLPSQHPAHSPSLTEHQHSPSRGPGARALEVARCPGHSRLGGGDAPRGM